MVENGNGHVLKMYRNNQILQKKHIHIIMRDAASIGFEKFGFNLGKKANVTMVASATMCLFPKEFPSIRMLVPDTGRNSGLWNAANNKVRLEHKKEKEVGQLPSEQVDERAEDDEEMTMEEHLSYLKHAHVSQKEAIFRSLKCSFAHRRHLLLDPENDILELIFSFFLCDDSYITYEYTLLLKYKEIALVDPIVNFNRYIKLEILQEIQPSLKNIQWSVPEEIKPYLGLIKVLGVGARARGRVTDKYATACDTLFELHPANTPNEEILEGTENTRPFIVGKFVGEKENVNQYFIVFFSYVIPMKKSSFVETLDVLYKLYHIFGIHYPDALVTFYKFLDECFYVTEHHGIPKYAQIYHKIMKIHETLESRRGLVDNSEMIEEDSQDSEMDEDEGLINPDNMEISSYVTVESSDQ